MAKIWYKYNAFKPLVAKLAPRTKVGFCVVDSLLEVVPYVRFCNCSMFCCALLCGHSILKPKSNLTL